MALARIITRSQACSRELALDLLSRGYAVEIVSPDSVPDNIADLELRVEEDPGNQLVASVEAHNGARSASLDFVHHLKVPMADFVRRPPDSVATESGKPETGARETVETVCVPEIRLVEEPGIFSERSLENHEVIAGVSQSDVESVSAATPVLLESHPAEASRPKFPEEETVFSFSLPDVAQSQPAEKTTTECSSFVEEASAGDSSETGEPVLAPTVDGQGTAGPAEYSHRLVASWRWRAALTFASMVLLAVLVMFGWRLTGTSARISGALAAGKATTPATVANSLTGAKSASATPTDAARVQGNGSNSSISSPSAISSDSTASSLATFPASKSAGNSDHTAKPSAAAHAESAGVTNSALTKKTVGAAASHRNNDELIARDTVTYLDERYKPATKAHAAKHPPRPAHKRSSGVVAANGVVYLDPSPALAPAK